MNGLTLNWKRIFAQWNIEHRIFTNSLQYLLNLCTHENPQSKHRIFLIERCPWYVQDFPGISASKESTCNAGNPGSIPGSGRSPGEGNGYPLQYSWTSHEAQLVKNPPAMRGTWVQSQGWEDPLEKEIATHSSILAWRTSWTV